MTPYLPPGTYLQQLRSLAKAVIGGSVFNAPLSEYSSWQIGGPADLLVEAESAAQVATVVRFAREQEIPLVMIGQGTNLLFDDAGLRGIVLKLGSRFGKITVEGERIHAQGGAWVPGVARRAMQAGLVGLEHIIGIPGTLGGLVAMNGGSQRKGIGENVCCVQIVERDGTLRTLSHADCHFAYRESALQGSGAVVVGIELECERGETHEIRRAMLADLRERRRKFPRKVPNCGSVFLSTGAMHATVGPPGKIIEEAGLKGFRVGNAEVSRQHANFIVNRGGASAREVLDVIAHVRRTVQQRIGFELCCEVRHVSTAGEIRPAHQVL